MEPRPVAQARCEHLSRQNLPKVTIFAQYFLAMSKGPVQTESHHLHLRQHGDRQRAPEPSSFVRFKGIEFS